MGKLWTEVVEPAEITGFARAAVEDLERQKGTLAQFLPNVSTPDVVVRTQVEADGTGELAQYRSFDAETPIGSGGKGARKVFELLPLGLKERVGEYDQLRARGNAQAEMVRAGVDNAAIRTANAIVDRLEVARGQVLDTGKLTINENGVVQEIDFGRAGHSDFDASVSWTDANSDPIATLMEWVDSYSSLNQGSAPGAVVVSRKVMSVLQRSSIVRALAATMAGAPAIVSREALQAVAASFGLPPLVIYDRKIRGQFVLDPDKIYLLPSASNANGAPSALGATFYGQTLEASESEYSLPAADQPGLVVGVWKSRDPIAVWVHSNAIALPVLVNPAASMVVRVLMAPAAFGVDVVGDSGTYTLTFRGNTTAGIAPNANATAVKSALVALDDGFKAADWDVSGSAGSYLITTPGGTLTGSGTDLVGAGAGLTITPA